MNALVFDCKLLSLQLYLNKEQTTFIKLVNEIRKDIALHCLKDKNASIDEIAYVLGFSEASAFHRAFKKWTRLTPNEFRTSMHFSIFQHKKIKSPDFQNP